MRSQITPAATLTEWEIKEIVVAIEEAKAFAKQVPEYRFARFQGSLSMILRRIDKRIGDAVWME